MSDQLAAMFNNAVGMLDTAPARSMQLFTEITSADETACDAWVGRIRCGDTDRSTLFRAWYSRGIPWAANNVAGAHTQPPVTVRATRWAGEVTVEWDHPYCRVTAFEVQSSTDGNVWTARAVVEPVATNLTFPSDVPVKVRVRAIGTDTTNWTVPVIAAAA